MKTLSIESFQPHLPSLLSLLSDLVHSESPSTDKAAVDRLGLRLIEELQALGGEIQVFPQARAGDSILWRWGDGPGGLLTLCHIDTVYDLGTLARQPFREADGRIYGPGVLDMKGSIAILLTVLRALREEGAWPARPVAALFTTDEETGSLTSRALIESEARRAAAVFCLEPALANGAIKTARKGTGDIEVRVKAWPRMPGSTMKRGATPSRSWPITCSPPRN